jgi:Fe-S-cluster-containing dehydrogenase component/CRP-like cAMP-binding protein
MSASWPKALFQSPILRGLDERGRRELALSGELRELSAGESLYRPGDKGETLFVVATGEIELFGAPRGEEVPRELRRAGAGDSFGEEASIGATRRTEARVAEDALVAEIPVALFRRALTRAGGHEVADRFERRVRRRATAELLATSAFTGSLEDTDRELLLDGAEHHDVLRGEVLYRVGEPATQLWLVADGMVQLQTEDDERLRVRAYLVKGDFFGDDELLGARPRQESAVASGASLLIAIPADVVRTVADRNPGLLPKLRRVRHEQREEQHDAVAASNQTQHAFHDLYRLQVARSLLVIDLDSCIRCGHCAWACESLHGVARLVRRGDKIVTRVGQTASAAPLLLPNSCQHCEVPACMPDCPTGAIGRDPRGEVFIRDALCTGCGACAKGCPWDNIQIVPRPPGAPSPPNADGLLFDDLAVKCDLCRDYDGPACVKACPTESIFRLDPAAELPDVARALRQPSAQAQAAMREPRRGPWLLAVALMAAAGGAAGVGMHQRELWFPWQGPGWGMGVAAAIGTLLLVAYSLPKRLVRVWSRPRRARDDEPGPQRSLVRPQLTIHLLVGLASLGMVLAHGGGRFGWSSGGALAIAWFASATCGGIAALCYALVPPRLARIERVAALPEDFAPARRELVDQLYGGVSGRSDVVKKLFERVLVPYLRRPFGWLWLVASGRDLRSEEKALRRRIDRMLEGRGAERLAGLEHLIRLVVELRALSAQRMLTFLLRMWLPAHGVAAMVALALLLVHLVEVLR